MFLKAEKGAGKFKIYLLSWFPRSQDRNFKKNSVILYPIFIHTYSGKNTIKRYASCNCYRNVKNPEDSMNTRWSELLSWYLSKRSGWLKRGSNGTVLDLISQFLHFTTAITNKNQRTNFSILSKIAMCRDNNR